MALIQVDTKDILFICGGAFIGLDRQVAERTAMSSIGFGNPVRLCIYSLAITAFCLRQTFPFMVSWEFYCLCYI